MYMSAEMLENQEQDNRYLYCLEQLEQLQKRKMEYQQINRPELKEVQNFDFFYRDFREILQEIYAGLDETDTLLLNISSGTPAMKSGLLVLRTLGEYPCKLIQVTTPEKKINEHIHKNYDVKTLWELNEDNRPDFQNRCEEIECPTLSSIKNEEIIKKHIQVYDYQAALTVMNEMRDADTKAYRPLIEIGAARIMLDFKEVDRLQKIVQRNFVPIRDGNKRKYFEYGLNLYVKLKRKEYADFLRAATPLIADLFELVIEKQFGLKIDDFCSTNNQVRRWNERKLITNGDALLKILEEQYADRGGFSFGNVNSDSLRAIIIGKSEDQKLKQLANELRDVESKVRNIAAHEIVSITDAMIAERTGFTSLQIFEKIRSVFAYTNVNVKKEDWASYDDLNREICEAMSASGKQE